MFGKGNHRQQEAGAGKKMVKQTSVPKKQSQQQQQQQQQQSKNEPFSLGWEVPQNNLRGQQEITGKIGVGYNQEDYQKMQQQNEIQQNKQNHKSNSQQRVGKQTIQPAGQNIFNIEDGQKLETENAKGYGNFYNLDKGQLKKKTEEETQKQGYGQFYERNQYGDFTNIPRPAQQLKR